MVEALVWWAAAIVATAALEHFVSRRPQRRPRPQVHLIDPLDIKWTSNSAID